MKVDWLWKLKLERIKKNRNLSNKIQKTIIKF